MEGHDEIKGLTQVCTSVFICLAYCFYVVSQLPKGGSARVLAILPVISIFAYLPLLVSSLHFAIITSGLITWMCSMKLILFAFDQGPLSRVPCLISFSHFILTASLPIQVKQLNQPPHPTPRVAPKSAWNYIIKTLILLLIIHLNNYYIQGKLHLHPNLILFMGFFFVAFAVEFVFALTALLVKLIFGLEPEAQFDEPLMATSLQDFWGKRWNLTNSSLLRLTVYQPIQRFCAPIMGPKYTQSVGLLATFLVSGLMHELQYFHGLGVKPSWEVTLFFVLHGVCTSLEILAKGASRGRWQLHPIVSWFFTISFLMASCFWLYFPPFLRAGVLERGGGELTSFVKFIKGTVF